MSCPFASGAQSESYYFRPSSTYSLSVACISSERPKASKEQEEGPAPHYQSTTWTYSYSYMDILSSEDCY